MIERNEFESAKSKNQKRGSISSPPKRQVSVELTGCGGLGLKTCGQRRGKAGSAGVCSLLRPFSEPFDGIWKIFGCMW